MEKLLILNNLKSNNLSISIKGSSDKKLNLYSSTVMSTSLIRRQITKAKMHLSDL